MTQDRHSSLREMCIRIVEHDITNRHLSPHDSRVNCNLLNADYHDSNIIHWADTLLDECWYVIWVTQWTRPITVIVLVDELHFNLELHIWNYFPCERKQVTCCYEFHQTSSQNLYYDAVTIWSRTKLFGSWMSRTSPTSGLASKGRLSPYQGLCNIMIHWIVKFDDRCANNPR